MRLASGWVPDCASGQAAEQQAAPAGAAILKAVACRSVTGAAAIMTSGPACSGDVERPPAPVGCPIDGTRRACSLRSMRWMADRSEATTRSSAAGPARHVKQARSGRSRYPYSLPLATVTLLCPWTTQASGSSSVAVSGPLGRV